MRGHVFIELILSAIVVAALILMLQVTLPKISAPNTEAYYAANNLDRLNFSSQIYHNFTILLKQSGNFYKIEYQNGTNCLNGEGEIINCSEDAVNKVQSYILTNLNKPQRVQIFIK